MRKHAANGEVANSPKATQRPMLKRLRGIREGVQHGLEMLTGEAVRDWPYIAEIGRMLGMR
jgi:hypothetical protein